MRAADVEPEHDAREGVLLSLDPSIRSPGVTVWQDAVLVLSGRVSIPAHVAEIPHRGARQLRVAHEIIAWLVTHRAPISVIRTLAFEYPQIYRMTKSKGDPNHLPPMVGVSMALAATLHERQLERGHRPPVLRDFEPDEWAGQLPKTTKKGEAWKSPRGERIRSRLEPGELARIPAQHDAVDSVGIGLHELKRLAPVRVFAGARPG